MAEDKDDTNRFGQLSNRLSNDPAALCPFTGRRRRGVVSGQLLFAEAAWCSSLSPHGIASYVKRDAI